MGAVMNQIPEHVGLLGKSLVQDQALGIGRQCKIQQLTGGIGDLTEPCCLSIAEDAAPEVGGHLANRNGLGEQHS